MRQERRPFVDTEGITWTGEPRRAGDGRAAETAAAQ